MNSNGFGDRLLEFLTPRGPRSLGPVWRYGLAVMIAVVATALRRELVSWMGTTAPYNLPLVGVVVATVLLGSGPGLVTVVLGCLGVEVFVLGSLPMISGGAALVRLGLSLAIGAVIVGLFHLAQVAQARSVKSQTRLGALAEATFEGVVESEGGRIVDCNEQFARMTGRTVGELKGVTIAELIPPEDRERVLANIEGNCDSVIEHAMLGPDGMRLIVESRCRPLLPESGRRQTAVRDITERKRAQARTERLEVLEAVFQSAPSFLHVLRGPEFVFEFANEAYYRLVGRRELLGRPAFEALPEAAKGGYQERIAQVMATRGPFVGRELPLVLARTPDGPPEERLIDLVYLPLLEPDGTCTRVLGHGTDVTELVRARQRVEEEYRSLFAHMLEGFAYCRLIYENGVPSDFLFLGVNGAFERLAGLKNVVGRKVSEVIHGIHQSNPELLQIYGRVALTGQPERFETYVELLGAWFSISVFSPQKEHFVTVFDNITERKQAEANQTLLTDVLHILNRGGDLHAVTREVLGLIRERAGFDAVGLRLRQGEDCPYFEQSGFSQDFLREENFLCAKGPGTAILRDAQGQPMLECTCGLVLSGRTDPKMSCFSLGGSFWTNASSELLALAPQDDPRNNPRNRCIHSGYQSVGLFPVRAGQEIVGLLQLNDRRPGRFTPESLAFYEMLAQNLGLALQRAAAAEALRASEAKFRRVFTNDMVPMGIWTESGAIEDANDALLDLVGLTRADLEAGRIRWDELTPAEYRQRDWEAVAEVRAKGFCTPYEKCYRHKDGHLIPIVIGGGRIDDQSGKGVLFALDITKRKRAEEALRESEAQLRSAALGGSIGLWSWKLSTGQVVVSANWRSLFGVGAAVVVTFETWRNAVHPEDRERALKELHEALEQRRAFNTEYRVVRPDGTLRWIVGRGQAWYDEQGRATGVAGMNMDITEQKEAQQVLARGREELERLVAERTGKLQELVGELEHFSYTITHDMRAPLRGMMGYAELMGKTCATCEESDTRRFLERIMSSAERMDALITDALQYAKAVRQELELAPVDVGALLRGMLDSYPEFQPSRARIELRGEIPLVMGNAAGLTQCFSNLLGNAVKFAKPEQRPEVLIWAEIRRDEATRKRGDTERLRRGQARTAAGSGGWVRIWVEDKGIGIPAAMVPRVFEMFSRGHNTYEGTGIGLALVRKVVGRMGGMVGVESEEGKGSRFWVELESAERRVGG